MANPVLPQHDADPAERAADLLSRRAEYAYNHELLGGVALATEVPREDRPSLRWWLEVAEVFKLILGNAREVAKTELCDGEADDPELVVGGLDRFGDRIRVLARGEDPLSRILKYTLQGVVASCMRGQARSLAEFDLLYPELDRPAIALRWQEDRVFAHMRVAGPNPTVLHRVEGQLPEHFPVDEAVFARAGLTEEGDSLAAALAEGRAYLADYAALEGLEAGTFPECVKYVSAPLALFVVPPRSCSDRALRPVAIQCQQRPGPDNPVWTPADGHAWLQAKLAVQTADGNIHQAITHLAHTHLLMEAVTLAARRQLSERHPLAHLLEPHIEGTLYINEQAELELMAEGGGVDYILSGSIEASRAVAAAGVHSWQLSATRLPELLARQGLDDKDALPEYPYRDDGELIWAAIDEWVGDYLRVYYRSDADVVADFELQAFAAELVSEAGGRLHGWASEGGGQFTTRAELIAFVGHLIYTASAGHAAFNYPQLELMSYAPAYPLAQYAPTPTRASEANIDTVLAQLPSLQAAHIQSALGVMLGSLHYTKLGDYQGLLTRHFDDERVHAAEARFVERLELAQATIERRNAERWMAYPYLLPERIPQSINV